MGPRWAQASRDTFQYYNRQCSPAEGQPCLPFPSGCISPSVLSCASPLFSPHHYSQPFIPPEVLPWLPCQPVFSRCAHVGARLVQPGMAFGPMGSKRRPALPLPSFWGICATSRGGIKYHWGSAGIVQGSVVTLPAQTFLTFLLQALGSHSSPFPSSSGETRNGSLDKKISTEFFDSIHAAWVAVL